jgi:hypothetical protein
MEGMNLSTIKKLVEGKRVWIKKDNEYQFFKCVIKTAEHDGCICQLDNGKVIKFHYGQLQAFRTVIELDRQEFEFWCRDHKKMLQEAERKFGKKPEGAVNDIYKKAEDYLSDSQLNDLYEMFERLKNNWEVHTIDTYYDFVKGMLK